MKKVFLYLYPIEEYTKIFLFYNDKLYDEMSIERPLPILNDTINKMYREKGYEIVFAVYPDKELYGIEKCDTDKIIYTDITFSEASAIDANGNRKTNFIPKYPNELFLINQLGNIDKLIVGGYHAMDCVKKVAEVALENGIDTLVDLDLTDLFFNLYKQKEYFNKDKYDPTRYKSYVINKKSEQNVELTERTFNRNYDSNVYGFSAKSYVKK